MDILILPGFIGVFIAFYLLLLRFLPRYLSPEAVRGPLHWAHRGSVALVLLAIFVSYSPWHLRIRSAMFFYFVVVVSGLFAGLLFKLGLVSGRALGLVRAQARLTPWLIPILFLWACFYGDNVVYSDGSISIDFEQNTGMISEVTTTQITLYQSRALLFEQRIGDMEALPEYDHDEHGNSLPYTEEFGYKEWWTTVNKVVVNPAAYPDGPDGRGFITGLALTPSREHNWRIRLY